MHKDIERTLYSEPELRLRVRDLGYTLAADYQDKDPIIIGVLKGSFVFMADLIRAIDMPCQVEFLTVSSYGSKSESTGRPKITQDLDVDIEKRHVILVEDIVDSGQTLRYLLEYLKGYNPTSIEVCALFDKPDRRKIAISAKYTGFIVPDAFIVGYGLDFAEKYRNLPYVGILRPELYKQKTKSLLITNC